MASLRVTLSIADHVWGGGKLRYIKQGKSDARSVVSYIVSVTLQVFVRSIMIVASETTEVKQPNSNST